jgi:hypothetical protein
MEDYEVKTPLMWTLTGGADNLSASRSRRIYFRGGSPKYLLKGISVVARVSVAAKIRSLFPVSSR